MAEWKDVIHQLVRICKRQEGNCGTCVLSAEACPNSLRFDTSDEAGFVRLEKTVMSWAAENPELVYPTWGWWLQEMGLIRIESDPIPLASMRRGIDDTDYIAIKRKMIEPIPADIAEKLGLEPKEDA